MYIDVEANGISLLLMEAIVNDLLECNKLCFSVAIAIARELGLTNFIKYLIVKDKTAIRILSKQNEITQNLIIPLVYKVDKLNLKGCLNGLTVFQVTEQIAGQILLIVVLDLEAPLEVRNLKVLGGGFGIPEVRELLEVVAHKIEHLQVTISWRMTL